MSDYKENTREPPEICDDQTDKAKKVKRKGSGQIASLKGSVATNDLLRKITATLAKGSPTQQLILGSVSGWTSGFLLMKVGRPAAFVAGGGIIISQAVFYAGYGSMDWDKIKDQAKQATKKLDAQYNQSPPPEWLAKAKNYSRSNPCFAAGFVGGFLIGVVS